MNRYGNDVMFTVRKQEVKQWNRNRTHAISLTVISDSYKTADYVTQNSKKSANITDDIHIS
jgi:hypothetical protein